MRDFHLPPNSRSVSAELAVVPTSLKNALYLSGGSAFSSSLLGSRGQDRPLHKAGNKILSVMDPAVDDLIDPV